MIISARVVLPMDGPPMENAAIRVEDAVVVDIAPAADLRPEAGEEIVALGEMVLLPGLINAHCHLDYTTLRGVLSPPKSFTGWVQKINALKRTLTSDDYLHAIGRGFAELLRWGTTSVCNVESFPELMPGFREPPMRTWWFHEMIDIRHRLTTEEVVIGALSFFQPGQNSLNQFGLSPHAPYTASRPLYELSNACARTMRMCLTTHVAESVEEREMFRHGRGELYEFMKALGRPMGDCGCGSPFLQLWKSGAINERWLLVHMNELGEDDLAFIAALPEARKPHIVHCPGSHAYFGHSRFAYRRLREAGANLCLGTDSLASTHSLSLFEEMRAFRRNEPQTAAEEVLAMVTRNPARALQAEGQLGCIAPGAWADLIALPLTDSVETVHEQVVNNRQPVSWMMIDGKIRTF